MKLDDVEKAAELARKYLLNKDELEKFLVLRSQFTDLWVGVKIVGQRDNQLIYTMPEALRDVILTKVEYALTNKVTNLKSRLQELGVELP